MRTTIQQLIRTEAAAPHRKDQIPCAAACRSGEACAPRYTSTPKKNRTHALRKVPRPAHLGL